MESSEKVELPTAFEDAHIDNLAVLIGITFSVLFFTRFHAERTVVFFLPCDKRTCWSV
jgi:hypothetical protein